MAQVEQSTSTGDIKFKNVCVFEKNNKYPETIPKERGSFVTIICSLSIFVLFLVDLITNQNSKTAVIALYMAGLLINIGLQILYRSILVLEERRHIISRYGGNYYVLLKDAYHFRANVCIAAVIAIVYDVYYLCTNNFFTDYRFNCQIFLLIPSIYLLGLVLQLESSPLHDSLWIAENNGLDYGSGMAYSFFHGYLKLVLPKTGTEEKGIKELMQDYEDRNHIEFAAYKLFILIPTSLTCFVSLKNEHCPSVDESSTLKCAIGLLVWITEYRNLDYEYTISLFELQEYSDYTGEYYEKHKNDIVLQFYLTLKTVLATTGLSDVCELIYYDDCYKGKDNHTHYYDVGKIILTRLKQLKKFQKKLHQKIE